MKMTLKEWKNATDKTFQNRSKHPLLEMVDTVLENYLYPTKNSEAGDWNSLVKPLWNLLLAMDPWMKHRDDAKDPHRKAGRELALSIGEQLRSLMKLVGQGEFEVLGSEHPQRFLATSGMLSCMTVMLSDKDRDCCAMTHLYAAQIVNGKAATNLMAVVNECFYLRRSNAPEK